MQTLLLEHTAKSQSDSVSESGGRDDGAGAGGVARGSVVE